MSEVGVDTPTKTHKALRTHRAGLLRAAKRIAKDRTGSSLIETAIVMPVLLAIMSGIIDMGFMFAVQNNMTSVSQDASRLVAVGKMTTSEAKSYASTKLMSPRLPYTISANTSGQNVVVAIAVPNKDVALIDFLGLFQTGSLHAQSSMRVL